MLRALAALLLSLLLLMTAGPALAAAATTTNTTNTHTNPIRIITSTNSTVSTTSNNNPSSASTTAHFPSHHHSRSPPPPPPPPPSHHPQPGPAPFPARSYKYFNTTIAAASSESPLEVINPWLSACDLQPTSATDLQGACSATTTSNAASAATLAAAPTTMWGAGDETRPTCPPPCPAAATLTTTVAAAAYAAHTTNASNTQCLHYLEESHKDEVCGRGDAGVVDRRGGGGGGSGGGNGTASSSSSSQRWHALHRLRMRHCCEHDVASALPPAALQGGPDCRRLLDALLEVDALAARISCEFAEVLTRYDCGQSYSIVHNCDDCKEAYRRWVCSSFVPHYRHAGERVRPCRSVCQKVEQQCPYMLPGDRAPAHPTQYAGEPTFLCLDPNIPETGQQRVKSSHGDEDCCYTHCGSPGRPCVHCTGRPSIDVPVAVRCTDNVDGASWSPTTTSTAVAANAAAAAATRATNCKGALVVPVSASASTAAAAASAPRTRTKVHTVYWTASNLLVALWTTANTFKCLLVLCANSARTLFRRIKTKWRAWSSSSWS